MIANGGSDGGRGGILNSTAAPSSMQLTERACDDSSVVTSTFNGEMKEKETSLQERSMKPAISFKQHFWMTHGNHKGLSTWLKLRGFQKWGWNTPCCVSLSLSLSLTLGQWPHVLRRPLTRIDHCGVFHYCQSSRFSSCWVLQAYRRPNPRRPRWAVFTPYKYSAVAKTFLNGGGCQTQGGIFHRKINFL